MANTLEQVQEIAEIANKIAFAYSKLDESLGSKYGLGKTTFTIWDNDNNAVAQVKVSDDSDILTIEFQR